VRISLLLPTVVVVLLSVVSVFGEEKPGVPEDYLKEQEYFAGNWIGKGRTGDDPMQVRMSSRWALGKHCLIFTGATRTKGEQKLQHWTFVSGWDAKTKSILDAGFNSNGDSFTTRWTVKSPEEQEGDQTDIVGGKEFKSKAKVLKKGPASFIFIGETHDGKEVEILYKKVERRRGGKKAE